MPVEVKVPEVGESVTEVFVGEWHKAEGDEVKEDEELVELESEKATFDAPSPASGVLKQILKKSGQTAAIGEVIAYIDDSKGAVASSAAKSKSAAAAKRGKDDEPQEKAKPKAAESKPNDGAAKEPATTPASRRLLEESGLSPADVEATGPGGRLLKEDVLKHIQSHDGDKLIVQPERKAVSTAKAQPGREEEVVPMSPIRRRIAERLVKAQHNAALLTTFNEIDMSAVMQLRAEHKERFREKYSVNLGYMSFFVKAAIDALMQFPALNAEVRGTDVVYHNYYDIGIAVALENGLVVPVLRDAQRMSFAEIEQKIDELAKKARSGKLSIDELQGGTFTISNGGIYGSLLSTPIVNLPQSGVLGMHTIQERPVVRDGQIVARPMMYVALSYDHRIVDGREAVSFLKRIKEVLEEPARMLIEA